jgi:hypothetical protein
MSGIKFGTISLLFINFKHLHIKDQVLVLPPRFAKLHALENGEIDKRYLINQRGLAKLFIKHAFLKNIPKLHMPPLSNIRAHMITRNRSNQPDLQMIT